ncbi:MAG: double-strand break repair protein AddB [Rhizobiales bacterium]|nr:double-strand break repair protein AddB [Hyphomicrobiales bacterium]NRB14440.1 double-strand break repair protein AddB [Hyphomicrobiales bacterium]
MQNIYNIPSGYSFLRELARAILGKQLPNMQKFETHNFSQLLILLPTQRACRDLREILFDENNRQALIMPEIKAFGALEDDWATVADEAALGEHAHMLDIRQAISPLDRQLILAKYIGLLSKQGGLDGRLNLENPSMALHMAKDLAKLFDSVLIEEADASQFESLVESEFAENWLLITRFLDIVFKTWPDVLAAEGKIDQIIRRQMLMDYELANFVEQQKHGNGRAIIAAGSTGSVMATKKFLTGILSLDLGAVILPGLDNYMDADSWESVDLAHPQHNLKSLLEHAGLGREDVKLLPSIAVSEADASRLRRQIASEMVRPTATSHMWHKLPKSLNRDSVAAALRGRVELIEANTVQEEAIAISLMMRNAVHESKKAALITPDRQLARRVQSELKRWDIEVDDSSGVPLNDTQPALFMQHIIMAQLAGFSPSALLSLIKHPYFITQYWADDALALSAEEAQQAVLALELILLRGVRPAYGIDGLLSALQVKHDQRFHHADEQKYLHPLTAKLTEDDWELARLLLENLKYIFAPLQFTSEANFIEIFSAHIGLMQRLSQIDSVGNSIVWQSHEGESLAKLSQDILASAANFDLVNLQNYEALLSQMMAGIMVRSKDASYGGLAILGAMEARLADLDIAILGGLNEGMWPQLPQADAWVSRQMMQQIGLPAPERRVGLSAHDFVAAFCVPKIYMTRAQKLNGAPTIASRWLLRLRAVLNSLDLATILAPTLPWNGWAQQLDRPVQIKPTQKPEPRPPVSARPKQMSVSDIETWIRDPYAIYAKKILKLKPLDDVEMEINAAEKGSLFHEILHQFSQQFTGEITAEAKPILVAIGAAEFADIKQAWPQLYAFWWPRFLRVADWFLNQETPRRTAQPKIYTERQGNLDFAAKYGADGQTPFRLTARADRLDIYAEKAEIIDYKTGAPPATKQVVVGFAPQLLLEAAILAAGGFDDCYVAGDIPIGFTYIQLTGGYPAGKTHDFSKLDTEKLIKDAESGLAQRIADFADQNTAYKPRELAEFAARFRDYDHLARAKEWSLNEVDDL